MADIFYKMPQIDENISENTKNDKIAIKNDRNCSICSKTSSFGVLIKCGQNECASEAHAMCALSNSKFQVEFRVNFPFSGKSGFLGEKIVFAKKNAKLLLNEVSSVNGVVYCEEHKRSRCAGESFSLGEKWVVYPKVERAADEFGCSFSPLKKYFDVEEFFNNSEIFSLLFGYFLQSLN